MPIFEITPDLFTLDEYEAAGRAMAQGMLDHLGGLVPRDHRALALEHGSCTGAALHARGMDFTKGNFLAASRELAHLQASV